MTAIDKKLQVILNCICFSNKQIFFIFYLSTSKGPFGNFLDFQANWLPQMMNIDDTAVENILSVEMMLEIDVEMFEHGF